jgi:hypothetical protein
MLLYLLHLLLRGRLLLLLLERLLFRLLNPPLAAGEAAISSVAYPHVAAAP